MPLRILYSNSVLIHYLYSYTARIRAAHKISFDPVTHFQNIITTHSEMIFLEVRIDLQPFYL